MKSLKKITALYLFLWLFLFAFSVQGQNLSQIQQQIQRQEQKIAQQKREQNKLKSSLKSQENQINNVIGQLRETELNLQEKRKLITETNKEIHKLEKKEKQQKAALAKQLDMMYRAGIQPSTLKKLLAEDSQKSERLKTYYAHLNQVRLDLIKELQATQQHLAAEKTALLSQQKEQQNLLKGQKKQQQSLQKAQQERQATLQQLNRNLTQDQTKLENLKANENALKQQIQRAEQMAREQEKIERENLASQSSARQSTQVERTTKQEPQLMANSSGLGQPKGQYAFPTNGKILHRFGSHQMGELKWKGIVIATAAGTSVKAIAAGRVILAHWLDGYGLMVIIKHGENDLSLYGYNQSLTVKAGQLVKQGQKIAEVGSSGGQQNPGLYFEIRRKGTAVNPMGWLK